MVSKNKVPKAISFRTDPETEERIRLACEACGVTRSRLVLMAVKAGIDKAVQDAIRRRERGLRDFRARAK